MLLWGDTIIMDVVHPGFPVSLSNGRCPF